MIPDQFAPVVRILLRWLGGFLIAHGFAHNAKSFADPDIIEVICYALAALCAVISEGWYYLARKKGWQC